MITKIDPILKDILHWYNQNKYIRIGSDVSVTELITPPQLVVLRDRHRPTIKSTDLSNEIPALVGTAVHGILQKYLRIEGNVSGKYLVERKLNSVINGIRVAGKFDALRDLEHLYDIKVTKVWKYIYGGVSEFETQLNIYDYMLYLDGYNIKTMTIMMVLLDWSPGRAWEKGYPNDKIMMIPIRRWTRSEQEKFIEGKVQAWQMAIKCTDNKLPECTPDERWAEAEVFKLYRLPSHQKATKNFNTETGAKSYQAVCMGNDSKQWDKSVIKTFRANQWKRCEKWCQVSDYCHQYKNR